MSRSHPVAWLLMAGYGGYTALTDGVGQAWVSGLLPPAAPGTGQGFFQGLSGFGVLVAGVWAGLAWGSDGTVALLVSGTCAAVLAAVVLLGSAFPSPSGRRGWQRPDRWSGSRSAASCPRRW